MYASIFYSPFWPKLIDKKKKKSKRRYTISQDISHLQIILFIEMQYKIYQGLNIYVHTIKNWDIYCVRTLWMAPTQTHFAKRKNVTELSYHVPVNKVIYFSESTSSSNRRHHISYIRSFRLPDLLLSKAFAFFCFYSCL